MSSAENSDGSIKTESWDTREASWERHWIERVSLNCVTDSCSTNTLLLLHCCCYHGNTFQPMDTHTHCKKQVIFHINRHKEKWESSDDWRLESATQQNKHILTEVVVSGSKLHRKHHTFIPKSSIDFHSFVQLFKHEQHSQFETSCGTNLSREFKTL